MNGRVVLPGGTGFVGRSLGTRLAADGYEVVVLSRSPHPGPGAVREVLWDGRTLGDWINELEGARAVVNLAGRSVNCRYNERHRREILESRLDSTRVVSEAMAGCARPPLVWLNSSTATIYRHTFDRDMDEATGIIAATPEAKDAFSIEVATSWERAFMEAPTAATRKVALRTAMVFGVENGGVYRTLRRLARWGLGGPIAGGNQWISWVHEDDFARAVEWLITHEDMSGPVNVAAPNPIPHREMMKSIRQVCGAPFGVPATRGMLEVAAFLHRTEAELILKSRRVVPARLTASGFPFRFSRMEDAIQELEDRLARRRTRPAADSPPSTS